MAEPLITLRDVSVGSDGRAVFEGTNWTLCRGEAWGVLGLNGSGKSLFGKALCGQAPIVAGDLHHHFLSTSELGDARYGGFPRGSVVRVGPEEHQRFMGQHLGFHQARWHASEAGEGPLVGDLLSRQSVEGINPYEVLPAPTDPDAFERRRRDVIRSMGLEPLLRRRVIQLSSGELRKLMLARALVRRPQVLVLDEPFAGLDADFRPRLRATLDDLVAMGTSGLVIITSRPRELPACVRKALLVRESHVVRVLDRDEAERSLDAAVARPARDGRSTARFAGATPLVDLRDVTIRYGDLKILDGVSFRVLPGEHWAITGPNGAGKSTLLSLILADHPQAYANHVEVLGHRRGDGHGIWETKAKIGWVSAELHGNLSTDALALDVVASGFCALTKSDIPSAAEQRERARVWLDRLLPGCADRSFSELSFGMQRLVLVARALVVDPLLLVLDEPCHGLDVNARRRVIEEVDRIARSGVTTLIFVTHQPDELPSAITHRLELREGRVVGCAELAST